MGEDHQEDRTKAYREAFAAVERWASEILASHARLGEAKRSSAALVQQEEQQ